MRLKIALAVLILGTLVVFSCTTKKPSEFDEVTIFTGKVVEKANGNSVENALVGLSWLRRENCTCILQQADCIRDTLMIVLQPSNQSGEYFFEIRWKDLGSLFEKKDSLCLNEFTLFAEKIKFTPPDTLADTVQFRFSLEDRTDTHVDTLALEP